MLRKMIMGHLIIISTKTGLNNNLIFAGMQWKIIRINGDGSVRLIYNGECPNDTCTINSTGTTTQIGTYRWVIIITIINILVICMEELKVVHRPQERRPLVMLILYILKRYWIIGM